CAAWDSSLITHLF
nr:immunoglobulin light chain junction region [Macaca mulatta]